MNSLKKPTESDFEVMCSFLPLINDIGQLQCRHCADWIDPQLLTFGTAYWLTGAGAQPKYPFHRGCKKVGQAQEAYECQLIDRSCNDCGFYRREGRPIAPTPLSRSHRLTDEEQITYLVGVIKSSNDSIGTCTNPSSGHFNATVHTNPNFCESMPCFHHRKDFS